MLTKQKVKKLYRKNGIRNMNGTKTILLIGRTGNGKSTLANVLVNKVNGNGQFEKFEEKFGESASSVSKTKKVQVEEFEEDGVKYRVVDTVGIGDTNMTLDKVLRKLALMGYSVKDGVSQIFFVTDGKLVEESKSTYELLKKVVFDENVTQYTTVIRTNFSGFKNEKSCRKEENEMIRNSESLKGLIEECNKIIYVDNPPVDVDDEGEVNLRRKRREDSRKTLLEHLKFICQSDVYKPPNLGKLSNVISKHMQDKEVLKENINKLNKGKPKVEGWKDKLKEGRLNGSRWIKMGELKKENYFLNKKITKEMIKHIGSINPKLKKNIEEGLKKLEKQRENNKEKPIRWEFEEATEDLQQGEFQLQIEVSS